MTAPTPTPRLTREQCVTRAGELLAAALAAADERDREASEHSAA